MRIINGHHGKFLLFKKLVQAGIVFNDNSEGPVHLRNYCTVSSYHSSWGINGSVFITPDSPTFNLIEQKLNEQEINCQNNNGVWDFSFHAEIDLIVGGQRIFFKRSALPGRVPNDTPTTGFRSIGVGIIAGTINPYNARARANELRQANLLSPECEISSEAITQLHTGFSVWIHNTDLVFRGIHAFIFRIHTNSNLIKICNKIQEDWENFQAEIRAENERQAAIRREQERLQREEEERRERERIAQLRIEEQAKQQEFVNKLYQKMSSFEKYTAVRPVSKRKSHEVMASLLNRLNCVVDVEDNSVDGETVTRVRLNMGDIAVKLVSTDNEVRISSVDIDPDNLPGLIDGLAKIVTQGEV